MRRCAIAGALLVLVSHSAWASGYSNLNTGIAAMNERRDIDALQYLGDAIAAPDLPPSFLPVAYIDRADTYLRTGNLSAAAADCDVSVKLRPDWFDSLELCGVIHLHQNDDVTAIADLTAAVAARPDLAGGYFVLADAYDDKSDLDDALANDAKGIALVPDSPEGYSDRARIYELQGRYDLALADRKTALDQDDDNSDLVRALGITQWALGQFDDAESSFRHALRGDPSSPYSVIWVDIGAAALDPDKKPDPPSASDVDLTTWPAPVLSYFQGTTALKDVMTAAAQGTAAVQKNQLCEANFYTAEWLTLHKSPDPVRPLLEDAVRNCPRDYIEFVAATVELRRLK